MAKSNQGISTGAAVGAGTAAAAVAAAAAYWFYGAKGAKKHRKKMAGWMRKAREEVFSAVEAVIQKAGDIDKETYAGIAKTVLERYANVSDVTASEIKEMTRELKEAWDRIQKARKTRKTSVSAKKAAKNHKKRTRQPKETLS